MKHTGKVLSVALAMAAAASLAPAAAATQSATGCPIKGETVIIKAAGFAVPALAINWTVQGMNQAIGFWAAGVQFGAIVPTSAATIATITAFGPDDAFQAHYARILDDLREAASAKRRVTVTWDTVTLKVSAVTALWNVAC